MKAATFIFAGGGTGGHLYPGLAIARELTERGGAGVHVQFVCSDRPLDAEILTKEGVEFVALGARPFSLRPRGLVAFCASWGRAVRQAREGIRDAAHPHGGRAANRDGKGEHSRHGVHVVAMGGFVAAPVVQAARVERCPVALVNLDAVPGKANRWIARHSARVFTAARVAGASPPHPPAFAAAWQHVRPIVRREAVGLGGAGTCRGRVGLDPHRHTFMVTGGSQGARSINDLMVRFVEERGATLRAGAGGHGGWQVLHQSGKGEADRLREAYAKAGVPARVEEFSDAMGDWWGAADVAVSRAGAGSVAEAWANCVPIVLLPYPHHRDEHQRLNAEVLVEAGGAVVAHDRVEAAANMATAGKVIGELLLDAPRRDTMRGALERLGPADGAVTVARALLDA